MPSRGLIIGKFYPPHRGHKLLIDTAASQVDELIVIVCAKPGDAPPGALRRAWVEEIHCGVRVLLLNDEADEQDPRVWAANCIAVLGEAPDMVFSSEAYGEPFAQALGARHVLVDLQRGAVPVSATQVRANPYACWEFLEPCVRAWYACRVCLAGAESTGKTWLARASAERFNTVWVPEYARQYVESLPQRGREHTWRSEEFLHIATRQAAAEDSAARHANRLLLCDTDAFATAIWHRRYFGTRSPALEAFLAARRPPHLYLVCDPAGVPFVDDGLRDGRQVRRWMHQQFLVELQRRGHRYEVLRGAGQERLAACECQLN